VDATRNLSREKQLEPCARFEVMTVWGIAVWAGAGAIALLCLVAIVDGATLGGCGA
jgi:hypothetical protein